MFKTRLLVALLLLPAFLLVLFGLPAQGFSLLFALLMLAAGWEYTRLCGLEKPLFRVFYLLVLSLLLLFLASHNARDPGFVIQLDGAWLPYLLLLWLLAALRLWTWRSPAAYQPPATSYILLNCLLSILLLAGAWYAISLLRFRADGAWWVLAMFFIIWAADVGAYLAGKALGRAKLVPKISPGKTRAGLYGGVLLAVLIGWLYIQLAPIQIDNMPLYLAGVLGISLISVIGDLYVSMHKRTTGIKDSSHLIPGHGGILDRLDSSIAAAPFYLALLDYL